MITKEEWLEWKSHQVSEMILQEMEELINREGMSLIERAGENQLNDRYMAGFLKGLLWFTKWEPEFIEEDQKDA